MDRMGAWLTGRTGGRFVVGSWRLLWDESYVNLLSYALLHFTSCMEGSFALCPLRYDYAWQYAVT